MSVSCGIVGLVNTGKTTLFNALTSQAADQGNYPFSTLEANRAVIEVPDDRLETIRRFIPTERILPAVVNVVDIAGLAAGASQGAGIGNKFLSSIKETDAIMHVVRCFVSDVVVRENALDPKGDMETVELELALADLDTVTRNLERVSKKARAGDKQSIFQKDVFARAHELLEEGIQLRTRDWSDAEKVALRPLCLLTDKPVLFVANMGDDDLAGEGELAQIVAQYAKENDSHWLPLCADLECELRRMDDEDREMFQVELGITELGLERLIRSIYDLLGLQTFFTAGEKEIRAWTIRSGDLAPVAAGVIHTDFEKKFIRAEVYTVNELVEYETEAAIKAAGRMRTEGRTYAMGEGDVVHFLVSP
jgi:GTP-binding protein YchF